MARTGPKKITAFIVETDWPGVEVVQRLHFMGLKALENGVIRFTNVRVPAENVIWGEGKGLKLALDHAQHRPPDAARLGGGRRQALPGDRAPVGGRAGAVGPADRQARGDRPEDRPHGGRHLRHGGGGRSRLADGRPRATPTSASRPRWPRCGTPRSAGGSSTTRCRSAAAAATRPPTACGAAASGPIRSSG